MQFLGGREALPGAPFLFLNTPVCSDLQHKPAVQTDLFPGALRW